MIVDKCKAADRGDDVCDYAFNAYNCFYNETHSRPNIVDDSESTFNTVSEADVEAEHNASDIKVTPAMKNTDEMVKMVEASLKEAE